MKKRNILLTSLLIILTASFVVLPQSALAAYTCGGAYTSIVSCDGEGKVAIINLLKIIIQIMTAGVGVSAVGATIFGAILYTSSADSPDKMMRIYCSDKCIYIIRNAFFSACLYKQRDRKSVV